MTGRGPYAYRWATILVSAASAVLMAFSIWFLTISFVDFRLADFRFATITSDFSDLGTCAGFVTKDQLEAAGYHDNVGDCNSDNKKRFSYSLLVSVHGIYHTLTRMNGKYWSSDMSEVAETLVPAIVGKENTIANDDAIQVMQTNDLLPSVNITVVYSVLSQVRWLPTSCESIYPGATKHVKYEQSLMKLKDTVFPIRDGGVPMTCGDETPTDDTADTIDDLYKWDKQWVKDRLYTHCLVQFRYANSGTLNWGAGTFGMPLVGEDPGPMLAPYPDPDHYNDTHHDYYNVRTKILLGQRFGWSMYAYTPMLLTSAFLMADAVCFWLAETTAPDALAAAALAGNGGSIYGSAVIEATSSVVRGRRYLLAVSFYLVGAILWGLYVVQAWGINENRLARPICESGEPDHEWNLLDSFKGTSGGWKADFDSNWLELYVIVAQGVVVFLLPLTVSPLISWVNTLCYNKQTTSSKEAINTATNNADVFVPIRKELKFFQAFFFPAIAAGGALMIFAQVAVNARLGMAWAEGIIGIEDPDRYNPVPLYEDVYKGLMAIFATVLVVGILVGTTNARWLINKRSTINDLVFGIWVVITFGSCTALLVVSSFRSLIDLDESNSDCKKYFDEKKGVDPITGEADVVLQTRKDFEMTWLCNARFWTYLIGAAIIAVVLILMVVVGVLAASGNLGKTSNTEKIKLSSARVGIMGRASKKIFGKAQEAAENVSGPSRNGTIVSHIGFDNGRSDFFSFNTGISIQGSTEAQPPATQALLSKNRPAGRGPMSNTVRFNLRSAVAQSPARQRPYGNGGLP